MMLRTAPSSGDVEADLVLGMLTNHAIPGVEQPDREGGRHTRLIHTVRGACAVSIRVEPGGLEVGFDDEYASDADTIEARVRRWFDLDAPLEKVAAAFGPDPLLAPLVAARPGLRVLEYPEPFEAAIVTVLGQQVSVAAARTFAGRLAAAYGLPHPSGLLEFPTPEALAAAEPEELRSAVGITGARGRTVQTVASAFCGRAAQPLPRSELLALPGVGPWTADYLDARSRGDRDAFVPGDLVVRKALGGMSISEATGRAESWRPFRGYALFHLWVAVAYRS